MNSQNLKHVELIEKLKLQLKELESYAYQTGLLQCLPSSDLLERQTVILNQLKSKLSLNFDELDRLGPDELKKKIDEELTELINPILMKEHLVDQLKTQITDLERYIAFLHGVDDKIDIRKVCHCLLDGQCLAKHLATNKTGTTTYNNNNNHFKQNPFSSLMFGDNSKCVNSEKHQEVHKLDPEDLDQATTASSKIIKRILTILQVLTLAQFGCLSLNAQSSDPQRPKATSAPCSASFSANKEEINPLLDRLRFSIQEVLDAAASYNGTVSHQSQLPGEPANKYHEISTATTDNTTITNMDLGDKKGQNAQINTSIEVENTDKNLVESTNERRPSKDASSDQCLNADIGLGQMGLTSQLPPDELSQAKDINGNFIVESKNSDNTSDTSKMTNAEEQPVPERQMVIHSPLTKSLGTVAISQRFIFAVRKHLVSSLRDLLGYGLIDDSSNRGSFFDPYYLLSSFTCLPGSKASEASGPSKPHVWNVIEKYYHSRSNTQFNASSAKTLSQSFNLSLVGTIKMSSKQALLLAVEDIIEKYSKQKRGPDSHFKAFVCLALNQSKLAIWLRIIFRNKFTIKRFYHDWSFVQSEQFDNVLMELERLSHIKCNLLMEGHSSKLESAF